MKRCVYVLFVNFSGFKKQIQQLFLSLGNFSIISFSNQKTKKQNLQSFWSYIGFGKVLKKLKNRKISRNIEFYIWRENSVVRKGIISYLQKKKLRYIF